MSSRREFIKTGVAASLVPAIAAAVPGKQGASGDILSRVIVDARFAPACAFGEYFERRGVAIRSVTGDITGLWYQDLSATWKAGPMSMAGMTLSGGLFCLDQLARDYGMRVVARSEHNLACDGTEIAADVHETAQHLWARPKKHVIVAPHLSRLAGQREPLVSWIIVPAGARMI